VQVTVSPPWSWKPALRAARLIENDEKPWELVQEIALRSHMGPGSPITEE